MTKHLKEEITHLLKLAMGHNETVTGLPMESLTDSIAKMVDKEFGDVLMKETSMGQMLEAVGLEIRSKE